MNNEEFFSLVSSVLNKDVRPLIEADGGRIKLKKIEDGVVYVQLSGACEGCPAVAMTLRYGVEQILKSKIDNIKAVEMIS